MSNLRRSTARATATQRNIHATDEQRTEYLSFMLAGDTYAAPVSIVREIVKPPPLTPVPRAPDGTMGIVSVRGQLVTVLDLRRRMRLTEAPQTRRTRILLVATGTGEILGLYVDEVQQVYRLAQSEIEPAATALGGDVAGYIEGIARPAQTPGSDQAHTSEEAPVIILLNLHAVLVD